MQKWSEVVSELPRSEAREWALATAYTSLQAVQKMVWAKPVKNELTIQPFATAARVWQDKKEAMENALEGLAVVL